MKSRGLKRIVCAFLAGALSIVQLGVTGNGQYVVRAEETRGIVWNASSYLINGDFETGNQTGWDVVVGDGVTNQVKTDEWAKNNTTKILNYCNETGEDQNVSFSQKVTLPGGTYKVAVKQEGKVAASGLVLNVAGTQKSLPATTGWDVWETVESEEFILEKETEVAIEISGTVPNGYWGDFDDVIIYKGIIPSWNATSYVSNGDFETGNQSGWDVVVGDGVTSQVKTDEWAKNNTTKILNYCNETGEDQNVSFSQKVTLTSGTYKVTVNQEGMAATSGLVLNVAGTQKSLPATTGWDVWETVESEEFILEQETEITIEISGTVPNGYWGDFDDVVIYKLSTGTDDGKAEGEDTAVEADVYVEKIADLSDDFITGADVSSYLSVINSGAKFYDAKGNLLDEQGFFDLLAEGGTNYIRLRVWHNPYDDNGNGYGGGNNDLEAAKVMGQYATNAGMKVLIDFHYSDFWSDPGKQQAPKAWAGFTVAEKEKEIYDYTKASLEYLIEAGVDVGMVQVGNETTSKFCGESSWTNICTLFNSGSKAIREVSATKNKDILVAIHFTNPEKSGNYANLAKTLNNNAVDYDVFATSYYPYWHGTISNLTSVLKNVADTYGKKVMVAETSWAFSLEDGDGHDNTVRNGANDTNQPYEFSVQGQCTEIATVAKAVAAVGDAGIGLFYWENAWIPVKYAYDEEGNLIDSIYSENKTLWEANGSGWASSYAAEYDPTDAGKWFGGSAVDNQAWFDFEGKALETVSIYNYIRTGTKVAAVVTGVSVDEVEIGVENLDQLVMPSTVTVKYNTSATEQISVLWNAGELANAIAKGVGTYVIHGTYTLKDEENEITTKLTIIPENLLTNGNFETGALSPWYMSDGSIGGVTSDDPHSGAKSYHYYSASALTYEVSQKVQVVAGVYNFGGYMQGRSKADGESYQIFVKVGDNLYTAEAIPAEWKNWQNPVVSEITIEADTEITVGFMATASAGAWGTWDDFYLHCVETYVVPGKPQPDENGTQENQNNSQNQVNSQVSSDAQNTNSTQDSKDSLNADAVEKAETNEIEMVEKITVYEDGSKKQVTKFTEETSSGKEVKVAVTVKSDANNEVTSATATVTTQTSGNKVSLSGSLVEQIKGVAGENTEISLKATDETGKTRYTIKVDAEDLKPGEALYIYALNTKTGEYTLVNAKEYKVTKDGSVSVSMNQNATYKLLSEKEAKSLNKQILGTVKVKKSSAKVKAGKSTKIAMSESLNANNVKKITYTVSDSKVAKVNKAGKITAKKAGNVTVKAKVTLKNGKTKTVKMKVSVN